MYLKISLGNKEMIIIVTNKILIAEIIDTIIITTGITILIGELIITYIIIHSIKILIGTDIITEDKTRAILISVIIIKTGYRQITQDVISVAAQIISHETVGRQVKI